MEVNKIFAEAVVETWRDRIASGECTAYEAEVALIKARDSYNKANQNN